MANHYYCSDGARVSKTYIDFKVREAKAIKIAQFLADNDFLVCEECENNDCKPIDCSHNISVNDCQRDGKSELAWDVKNITLRGRNCHKKHDGANLYFNSTQ